MIQPELQQVTPKEAAKYRLGSLLNGGGSWPNHLCTTAINKTPSHIKGYKAPKMEQTLTGIFEFGYGLKYQTGSSAQLALLSVETAPNSCDKS